MPLKFGTVLIDFYLLIGWVNTFHD